MLFRSRIVMYRNSKFQVVRCVDAGKKKKFRKNEQKSGHICFALDFSLELCCLWCVKQKRRIAADVWMPFRFGLFHSIHQHRPVLNIFVAASRIKY